MRNNIGKGRENLLVYVFGLLTFLIGWCLQPVYAACEEGYVDLNGICGTIVTQTGPNYINVYGELFDMGSLVITRGDESIRILDRDLGATEKSEGSDGYGYKFQWGNNFGFSAYGAYYTHLGFEVDSLGLGYSWQNPYFSHFFGDFSTDWSNPANDALWGSDEIGKYSMQGPCPEGTHIPTKEELEKLSLWMSGSANNMNNLLYMPFAGYRDGAESIPGLGNTAYYWSSSVSGVNSYSLVAPQNGDISITPNNRAKAASIRCFFDDTGYIVLSYDTMGGSLMQGQTVQIGGKAHVPGYDPRKDNSILEGRYKDSSYSEEFLFSGESEGLSGDTTIYAKWKCAEGYLLDGDECVKTHKVVFNSMGGTKVDPQTVISGNAIDYIVPTMTGADFLGWYYTQYYAIDVNDSRFPQGCNTEGLPIPEEYCVLSTPVKNRSYSGYLYVAPFATEVVRNAKMADYYCKNSLFIGNATWNLPLSREYVIGVEHAYFWTVMRNNRGKIFNFNAQGSGKPNHYWGGYGNPNESNNCILSAMCGRENSSTRISTRCITTSEILIDLPSAPSELTGEYIEGDIIEGTTMLDAKWSCKTGYIMENGICRGYEILFDAKGGSFSGGYNQNIVEYVINDEGRYEPKSPVEIPTKAGTDVFLGWYTDSALTQPFVMYPNGVELEGDITLYARYGAEPELCSVSFVDENGVELWSGEIYSGSFLPRYDIPEKYGYNALGWFESGVDDSTGWQFNTQLVTGDVVLYPQYEIKTYHVSYVDENGVEMWSGEITHGSYLTAINIPSKDGYKGLGWYQSGGLSMRNFITDTVSGDLILYPKYEKLSTSGGGGASLKKDVCPDGDCSYSYYDGLCEEDKQESSGAHAIADDMTSDELDLAYKYAYENSITTLKPIGNANLYGELTRIEMAKMLSHFAINVLGMVPDDTRINKFRDVSKKLDAQYNSGVELAYKLGIMGINMPNNKFRPFDLVPRAEFVAALSRMLYHTLDGEYENTPLYYTHHMEKLLDEKVMTKIDPHMIELRGYVMLMLYRSQMNHRK